MTDNDETVTQEWGGDTKTFDDSQTSAETAAFGDGLDDFDLDGGSKEPRHGRMSARGAADADADGGLLGRFMGWLKGVFGGS